MVLQRSGGREKAASHASLLMVSFHFLDLCHFPSLSYIVKILVCLTQAINVDPVCSSLLFFSELFPLLSCLFVTRQLDVWAEMGEHS